MHALGVKVKFRYYHNNSKECPFKKFGCKFRHEDAPTCKFKEKCKWNLCQFKHDIKSTSVSTTNTTIIKQSTQSEKNNDTLEDSLNNSLNEEVAESSDEDEEINDVNDRALDIFFENYCKSKSSFHIHRKGKLESYFGLILSETIAGIDSGKVISVSMQFL